MRKGIYILLLMIASMTFVACGGGGGGGSSRDSLSVASTGVAINDFATDVSAVGKIVYFLAHEASQNSSFLNGDQDVADRVMHVLEPLTGVVMNLTRSGISTAVGNDAAVGWVMSELAEGSTDFNLDGDFLDNLLVWYRTAEPLSVTNPTVTSIIPAAGSFMMEESGFLFFLMNEVDNQMQDLNGDGDTADTLIAQFDLTTGANTVYPEPWTGGVFVLENGHCLYSSQEASFGLTGVDYTGDGDTGDRALFVRRLSDGSAYTIPTTAHAATAGTAGILGTVMNPVIAYMVEESGNALGGNLNGAFGDTDESDAIIALWDVQAGVVTLPQGGVAVDDDGVGASADRLVYGFREGGNGPTSGGVDINGDGDLQDSVLHWVDLADPTTAYGTVYEVEPGLKVCDHFVIFGVDEADVQANLNAQSGDTDTGDFVAHSLILENGNQVPVNSGFAMEQSICFLGENLFFITSSEAAQGGADLNNDGDTGDIVPVMFNILESGVVVRGQEVVSVDGPITFQVCKDFVRVFGNASEENIYGDMNEDGDTGDYNIVSTAISRPGGDILSFIPLGTTDAISGERHSPMLVGRETVLFPFTEAAFGAGLNGNESCGDTDALDVILMYIHAPCPQ